MTRLHRFGLALLLPLWLAGAPGHTDPLSTLPDPTRAPAGLRKAPPGTPSDPVARAAAAASAQADAAPPRLQGIQRNGATGQAVAMLDGQTRQAGERQGDWTLMAIAADHVTLRGPGGVWRLWLTGGQDKLTQRGAAAAAPRKDQP